MRTKTFAELTAGYTTAVQASASGLVDFTVGSILRACGEAIAQVALWLQGLILALLAASRASTATGLDLDSWMADYGFTRLPAVKSNGTVTFARFTTTAAGLVPVGTAISSADGTVTATVRIDTANPAWDGDQNGYALPIGEDTVDVPVRAVVEGAAGNLAIGQANTIASSVPGIDTVTNAAPFAGGADAESDAAFRARFKNYLPSLAEGTATAVGKAVAGVAGVTDFAIVENLDPDDSPHSGFFYVVVDDGTGAPSGGLKTLVSNAVEAVRPIGTTFSIRSPTVTTATVTLTLTIDAAYDTSDTVTAVHDALVTYISGLGLGVSLPFTRLAQVAYDTSPAVTNVTSVTLNTLTADLTATAKQVIRAGTVTVSHT